MKTDDLIKGLSADPTPEMPMRQAWLAALAASIVLAAAAFFVLLGPRADIGAAMETWRFLFKFVVTILLAVTAWVAVRSLATPGSIWRWVWLLAAPALLFAAAMVEMMVLPEGAAMPRMMGTNSMLCLAAIPAIGLPPLGVFLAALRHGAPTRPALAGMVAGLLAGGIAATFYAMHCFDDSPLFVIVWYTLAIGILAAVGALAGRVVLKW